MNPKSLLLKLIALLIRLLIKPPVAPPPEPPKAAPVFGDVSREQWHSTPANATQLRNLFNTNAILKDWLAVAWKEIPRGYPSRGQVRPVTAEEAAHELGRINGYMACLDTLQDLMEQRPEPHKPVQMTYPKSIEDTLFQETRV